jgi:hypothetical protein
MSRPAGARRVARLEFSRWPLLPVPFAPAGTAAPGTRAALFAAPPADPLDEEVPDPVPPHPDSNRAAAMISPAVTGPSPGRNGVSSGMQVRRHLAGRRFLAADNG